MPATFEAFQANPDLTDAFFGLIVKELVIGFLLGVLVWMPSRGVELTGVLLDTQRGSTTAQDYDVIFGAQTPPSGILLVQIFSRYFFAAGGFLLMRLALFDSTVIWPPFEPLPPLAEEAMFAFIRLTGTLYLTAVALALPVSGFMVLADIVIAFVACSAPTLSTLTFGMPVKSAVMLIMLFFYVDIAYPMIFDTFTTSLDLLKSVLSSE